MMTTGVPASALSSAAVCALAAISYRQLDYWTRQGYLSADQTTRSGRPASGSGTMRHWPAAEARKAAAIAQMTASGLPLRVAGPLARSGRTATVTVTVRPLR